MISQLHIAREIVKKCEAVANVKKVRGEPARIYTHVDAETDLKSESPEILAACKPKSQMLPIF